MQHPPSGMKARASSALINAPTLNSRTTHAHLPVLPDIEEDERYYLPAPIARGTFRYTRTDRQDIIQQGNRRLHIHYARPPQHRHWLFPTGIGMLVMAVLFLLGTWGITAWQQHQLDMHYGNPRTWQTDAMVGHADGVSHPTHFIFEDLHAQVVIIELRGDLSNAPLHFMSASRISLQ